MDMSTITGGAWHVTHLAAVITDGWRKSHGQLSEYWWWWDLGACCEIALSMEMKWGATTSHEARASTAEFNSANDFVAPSLPLRWPTRLRRLI
eukprot:893035-Amphidinium_carterae.1